MRLSLYITGLSGGNLLLLFLLQWYVLITIGPGMETDALFAGMAVPQLVLAVISGSLMHVLVPLFAVEEPECFRRDAWGFFILIGSFFGSFAVIFFVFAPSWVPLLVPGFSDAGKSLTIELTRIQLLGMIFNALSGVLWAIYHARKRFIWAELAPLLSTMIGFVILVWALPKYGIIAAAWVSVLRVIFRTLLMMPSLGRYSKPTLTGPIMDKAWCQIKPLLFGASYHKMGPLLDRFLSSMTFAGGLSLFYLGQQIYANTTHVINKAVVAPLVPLLAGHAKSKNWDAFKRLYRIRLFYIIGLTGIGYLIFILVGKTLLVLLVGYGGITMENLRLLWLVMLSLVGVFIGGAMGQILSSAFYAKGNTGTPTKVGVIGFTLGIPLKVIGFIQFGLIGIAIGSTIYYFLNAFALYLLLERELNMEGDIRYVVST